MGLRLFPKDAELKFREGVLLHGFGRLAEAAEVYRQVLETNEEPHFASVDQGIKGYLTRHNLAVVYTEMGDLPKAEEQWRRVVHEMPSYRSGWRGLGDVLVRQRKLDEASRMAERLSADAQLQGEGVWLRSATAVARGDFTTARRVLEEAAAANPTDPERPRALSEFLLAHADPWEAEGVLKELIVLAPQDASAHHNLGTIYLRLQHFDEAIDAYQEALRLRPNHTTTWIQLGYALKESERDDEARLAFEEVIRSAPGSREAREAGEHLTQLCTMLTRGVRTSR
jgi:tetratricopeptide (TPR) repeat protein